ncbi:MAG: amylo-alpha-1,6-glucosidase [Fimbriimonas sp.]
MLYSLNEQQCRNLEVSTRKEWVLPNGIGGYAMGTASGINTRRYHGQLIAATTPPTGRMVLLAAVDAFIQSGQHPLGISANQYPGAIYPEGFHYLREFSVGKAACWRYRATGLELCKRLYVHPGVNAVTIEYENTGKSPYMLTLRPLVSHKSHHGEFHEDSGYPDHLSLPEGQTIVQHQGVELHIRHQGANRLPVHGWYYRFEHQRELERGLPARDDLFCPCELTYRLEPGEKAVLVASTDPRIAAAEIPHEEPSHEYRISAMLKDAAGKFFVRSHERSTIIAGYPWFTDWGRDTMISLPGLCIHTGRIAEAKEILRSYASQMRQGLIPNRFVEVGEEPDYNTVDATLWFANAIYKTLLAEWDEPFAREMFTVLRDVHHWHREGTLYGIHVDKRDGLLAQGEPGTQLTWMDAKVGEWVVTPRHGKPVEINGLWINLLRILEWLCEKLTDENAHKFSLEAEQAAASFEEKFWHPVRGHYLDTVDPTDASLRPNQVLAMALPFSPVNPEHARLALKVVGRELLTPYGLRTLGPNEPGYRGKFSGSLAELDAAYHQGTVWPWLIGSYATAMVRYCDDRAEAKRVLRNAKEMLCEYGLGGIAEVYDGDEPQSPGACPWQAWSVGEILRAWTEDVQGE